MAAYDGPRLSHAWGHPTTDYLARAQSTLSLEHAADVEPLFGQPSTYSLTRAELVAHVRTLRRAGWQSWEIHARLDLGSAA